MRLDALVGFLRRGRRGLAVALGIAAALASACAPPERDYPARMAYLPQGWTNTDRQTYYFTPQGAELLGIRYEWFRYLELPFSTQRFADPRYLSRFGFLYDSEQMLPGYEPPPWNPGNFPIGFTSHQDSDTGEAVLDITCAACHTGQMVYGGRAIRIDGGPALHAFASGKLGQFVAKLIGSMVYTYASPFEFDRFAKNVLGLDYPRGKAELRREMTRSIDLLSVEAYRMVVVGLFPVDEGYGRIDALTHITHTILGAELDPANFRPGTAPVSYPHLWDIWKFDWVQWNGSVAQPLARNVGEALNLAKLDLVDDRGKALPPDSIYRSSVLIPELNCIETTLWKLQAPIWDETLLPPIDIAKVARGTSLFDSLCAHCHGPRYYPDRASQATPGKPVEWRMLVVPQAEIGTDPGVVENYLGYRYDASALDPGNPALKDIDAGAALSVVTQGAIDRLYRQMGVDSLQKYYLDGWGRAIETRVERGYKARPLHGIWATSPYLHNGSVPNLYQMLLPEEQRSSVFWVGTHAFDPDSVGYVHTDSVGTFRFDTSLEGNYNTGHQFRDDGGAGVIGPQLDDEERWAILEFLKVYGSRPGDFGSLPPGVPMTPLYPPVCPSSLQGPAAYPDSTNSIGPSSVARTRAADVPTALAWKAWADSLMVQARRSGSDTAVAGAALTLADSLVLRARDGRGSP